MDSNLQRLEKLQTFNHSQILDVVDKLRALGLSNLLPLPQLIVCGDQSSGKSSVLEAISGVPFPRKDNLCTRFATELILRRSSGDDQISATVSIRPSQDRSETDKLNLRNFDRSLSDVAELPDAVQKAKEAMGLGSQGSNAFSTDVLRVEVTGPRMPQLTIVDLPGLIHSENRFQTTEDVELVSKLVHDYMTQKRSIILAVVSAKNDYANQIVLKMARKVDPLGQRTLGIITKPDTVHAGTESEASFLSLANNTDVVFKLGWHVIRNLDSNESLQDFESRDAFEENFFRSSNWRTLGRSIWGAVSLRDRLSEVLFHQITQELPRLMEEIEDCKDAHQLQLDRLGRSRETETEQRRYLAELNQKIYDVCKAGCDGNYDDAFFREKDQTMQPHFSRRIRAVLQNQSTEFAVNLEKDGCRWQLSERTDLSKNRLSRHDAILRAANLLRMSRGRELPGTFNPMLISELFHEYSEPWEGMARRHVYEVWQQATRFVQSVLQTFADDYVSEMYMRLVIGPDMDRTLVAANKALNVVLEELKQHAMTFNPYFTKDATTARNERRKQHMTSKLNGLLAEGPRKFRSGDVPWLVGELLEKDQEDMDMDVAEEIFDTMMAYYEMATKRLIDNVPILVIERVIVKDLLSIVQPVRAAMMDTTLVQGVAGESETRRKHRQKLTEKVNVLTVSETICKRYATKAQRTPTESESMEESESVSSDKKGDGDSGENKGVDDDNSSEIAHERTGSEIGTVEVEPF